MNKIILVCSLLLLSSFGFMNLNQNNSMSKISENAIFENNVSEKSHYVKSAADQTAFISEWDTTETGDFDSSNADQIKLPLLSSGTYDFVIDWGDGTYNKIINANYTIAIHTYASEGIYTINITGTIKGWRFNSGDCKKILNIQQWGSLQLGNSGYNFVGCTNLIITATDVLNLTGTTNLNSAFLSCFSLTFSSAINDWDVSRVVDMSYMFWSASIFNQNIGGWNVSSVTNMAHMFNGARDFNQGIGGWEVSGVTNMEGMFKGATRFNQDIGGWNVSNVTNMKDMFWSASNFNQNIRRWNVSSVTNMANMFTGVMYFNYNIGEWNVSSVTNMAHMFNGALLFNQNIGGWDVSNVIDMSYMFYNTLAFNQPLDQWDVSNVLDMSFMFSGTELSTVLYDNLLFSWSQLSLQNNVIFDAGDSKSSEMGTMAKQSIIDAFNWDITDGGEIQSITNGTWIIINEKSHLECRGENGTIWMTMIVDCDSEIHIRLTYQLKNPTNVTLDSKFDNIGYFIIEIFGASQVKTIDISFYIENIPKNIDNENMQLNYFDSIWNQIPFEFIENQKILFISLTGDDLKEKSIFAISQIGGDGPFNIPGYSGIYMFISSIISLGIIMHLKKNKK